MLDYKIKRYENSINIIGNMTTWRTQKKEQWISNLSAKKARTNFWLIFCVKDCTSSYYSEEDI